MLRLNLTAWTTVLFGWNLRGRKNELFLKESSPMSARVAMSKELSSC